MTYPRPVDRLPPESRFALRAVAAGLSIDEAGELLRLPGPKVRQHLRTAGRRLGIRGLSYAEGDAPFAEALAPALEAAREAPSRPSSKGCPGPDVTAALAARRLDGPLLLAEIDHAADCPACLARLVELFRSGAAPAEPPPSPTRSAWPFVVLAAAAAAALAWVLLR